MPRKNHKDVLERLLTAAKELSIDKGLHNWTLAELSTQADIPLGNIYYHLPRKEDVIEALVDTVVQIRNTFGHSESGTSLETIETLKLKRFNIECILYKAESTQQHKLEYHF